MLFIRLFAMFLCGVFPLVSAAGLIRYHIELEVQEIRYDNPALACDAGTRSDPARSFGCVSRGTRYLGAMDMAPIGLASDGLYVPATMPYFYLTFGGALFSTDIENRSLAGFDNALTATPSLAVLVGGGYVVDLRGTARGANNGLRIDFNVGAGHAHQFSAHDGSATAVGRLTISPIGAVSDPSPHDPDGSDDGDKPLSLPTAFALLLLGFAVLGLRGGLTTRRPPDRI